MIRPSHPLATTNNAHAWLESGLDADSFVQTMLDIEDAREQGLVACALMAAATKIANPEITLWVEELESRGIPTTVQWTPLHCSVAVINPQGPTNGRCEIGPVGRYLGYAEFLFDNKCFLRKVAYEFCYTQSARNALDRAKEATSMETFLRRAASELLIPGVTEFRQALALAREHEHRLRDRSMRSVLEQNAEKAFELIAEAGIPVPNELKPALEAYKTLTVPGEELKRSTRQTISLRTRAIES